MVIQKRILFSKQKNIKITKQENASSYIVEILNLFNPELQPKDTESTIKSKLIELSTQLKGFKFVKTLVLVFKKRESEDETKFDNFYSRSKAELFINKSDIDDVFQSVYAKIITNIQKCLGKGSGCSH